MHLYILWFLYPKAVFHVILLWQPRDQFLSRLMKKLKVDPGRTEAAAENSQEEEVGESWEDLDSEGEVG